MISGLVKEWIPFGICCFLIVLIILASNVIPQFRALERLIPYPDKFEHALAGILLVARFPYRLCQKTLLVFLMLIFFNFFWEAFEIWLSLKKFAYFDWQPFDKKWLSDTSTDILAVTAAGMIWRFLFRKAVEVKI